MLSMNQIAEAIEQEGRRLGKLAEETASIAQAAAEAEADYKVEFAKARMKFRDDAAGRGVKVTVDQVEDHATLEASVSLRNYLVQRESLTAIRSAQRASESRLDGLRSLMSSYRGAGA